MWSQDCVAKEPDCDRAGHYFIPVGVPLVTIRADLPARRVAKVSEPRRRCGRRLRRNSIGALEHVPIFWPTRRPTPAVRVPSPDKGVYAELEAAGALKQVIRGWRPLSVASWTH